MIGERRGTLCYEYMEDCKGAAKGLGNQEMEAAMLLGIICIAATILKVLPPLLANKPYPKPLNPKPETLKPLNPKPLNP